MNVIPCTTWVKKGVAAANPEKVQLTVEELESIIKETQSKLEDVQDSDSDTADNADTEKANKISTPQNDEYDFDNYDKETDNAHWNIGNLVTFENENAASMMTKDDDDDSEKEDDIIKNDDNLVLIGHVEGDASVLEVFVYNESEGSFYCHHDILLPSFPLCIEWLNYDPADSKAGNFCAIGNMTPIIEVWDLDIVDCLEPVYRLGSKANKKRKQKQVGHRNAVLDISWNENYTHILASGSVDETVLLWDLENCTPVTKFDSFNEKVQSLQWHPKQTHQLLTGCADRFIRLFDCREKSNLKQWQASGEVERVLWNYFDTNYCLASTDNGYIAYIDVRKDEPVWTTQAHEKEVTGLSLSSSCPGLLVTSSNDSVIKVWDIVNNTELKCVWEKKSNLGAIQCLASNPDKPFVFSVGGDNKAHNYKVIDFAEIPEVYGQFKGRDLYNTQIHGHNLLDIKLEDKKFEMMDVTEDMGTMKLNVNTPTTTNKKRIKMKK